MIQYDMEINFQCKECDLFAKITKEQAKAHVLIHRQMKKWFDEALR